MTRALPPFPARAPAFLACGGTFGAAIASADWAATPLGPVEGWPQTLKTTVALLLRSPIAMVLLWGRSGVLIYNEAYAVFAGARHPAILGMTAEAAFPDLATFNRQVLADVFAGKSLSYRDQELSWTRDGRMERFWLNLDYSPVLDEHDAIAGVIAVVADTTGKVRAERRLSGERQRLEQMFEQAPGFMAMLTGPEHVFALANRAYMNVVGGRPVLGLPVAVALPEAAAQGFVALLDQLYASGEAHTGSAVPFSMQAAGDLPARECFVDFVYQPVRDEHGVVFGIFVQGADVTARVLAERASRAGESKFRLWAQTMPNQVWSADASGQLDWFNDRVYEYSGAARGTLDGAAWAAIVAPEDAAAAGQRWADSVRAGQTYETEFRIRRSDGVFRWHLVRALPIADASGVVGSWIGTNTDIDDQKNAAFALQHQNLDLVQQVSTRTAERDRMWRLSSDLMLVADFAARVVSVNPAVGPMLGWNESELIGGSFMSLVHPDDVAATLAEVGKLSEGATTFRFENRYRCRDGSYRVLSWSAAPDAEFIHAVARDVTAERAHAEAIRQAELALQQSQKMETIGKLTGGVAHDFNNLLQVISGNLQLLSPAVAGQPKAARWVHSAMAGVERGAKLASSLLAFGRRQPLAPTVVQLGRYVAGMQDMLRSTLGDAVEVETVVASGLWNTLADTAQVENALLNLAINARDAMDGVGKLTIEAANASLDAAYCSAHADVAPGDYVALAVSDTGAGMGPEVVAQAFEPFFSTKPEGKGTGLGLSMVYGFVKQSGGHVKIYSEVGEGTTVRIYLPRSLDAEAPAEPVADTDTVGGRETILVAEDDEGVRATVVEMLGELGYQVLRAGDAAGALAVLESGAGVDLLFTDVVMPGPLRSPELARRARKLLPEIAVLFTSGYTENAIVHGGRLDPGVELLGKPYTRAALARKVRHVLDKRGDSPAGPGRAAGMPAAAIAAAPVAAAAPASASAAVASVDAPAAAAARDSAPAAPRAPEAAPSGAVLRILLVEDEADLRQLTADILELLGHVVVPTGDGPAALAELQAGRFDVLLTDIGLPGMSGDALASRALAMQPALRVIFATGRAMDPRPDGAAVLLKPYDLQRLADALAGAGAIS